MKKIIVLLSALVISVAFSNAQNCFWAEGAGGNYDDMGRSVATDADGNVYATGYFSASISFGDSTFTSPQTSQDIFVVKYNSAGTMVWAIHAGGALEDVAYGITTDAAGNVYVAGNFFSSSISFNGTELTNSFFGNSDLFVVKLTGDGDVVWARTAGGNSDEHATSIAVDADQNVYVAGNYHSDSLVFSSNTLINTNPSSYDAYLVKYDVNGDPSWAVGGGGTMDDYITGVASTSDGVVSVTGQLNGDTVLFAGDTIFNYGPVGNPVFVTQFDENGTILWKTISEPTGNCYGYDIAADENGNVFITGEYESYPITFGSYTLPSSGGRDIYIVKYNSSGDVTWAKNAGGISDDEGRSIETDESGNIYVAGYFQSPAISFGSIALSNAGYNEIFIVSYDNDGIPRWGRSSEGTTSYKRPYSIAVNDEDDVYVTGFFDGPVSFGSVDIDNVDSWDFFVAHIYSFNAVINSSSDVVCRGESTGSASTFIFGGYSPFTYLWDNGQTTTSATNLVAGEYQVTVADGNGCLQTDDITINEPAANLATICMVTVDSLSEYNIIIWDKTSFTTVDTFIVYREIATGNYQPVARVPFDSLSLFTDTVSTLYFPNTGDPHAGTYRYKIQAIDTCGHAEPMSPFHNTIYINNNAGTFFWQQLYTIEDSPNPVASYILMRDNNSDGNWQQVSSVAGTQQTISDPLYAAYQSTASWRVETVWNISCEASLFHHSGGDRSNFSTSLSNIYSNINIGVNENALEKLITVFPNPSDGKFTIQYKSLQKVSAEVFTVIGEKVSPVVNETAHQSVIDMTGFSSGVYYLKLNAGDQSLTRKIVLQ